MTREGVGDCHSQQLEAVTVSLGKRYRKLIAWAHEENLLDVLQVIYHALAWISHSTSASTALRL